LIVSCYYCSFDLQQHPYPTVSKYYIESYKLLGKPGRFRYTAFPHCTDCVSTCVENSLVVCHIVWKSTSND
jgi:hypothetical protein